MAREDMYGRRNSGPGIFSFLFILLIIVTIISVGAYLLTRDSGFELPPIFSDFGTDDEPDLNETEDEVNDTITTTTIDDVPYVGGAEIHFLDVGQGDSTLLRNGDKEMLIDCGKKGYGEYVVDYLKDLGVDRLEYLIVTHPDSDHVGGCLDVLKEFNVLFIYTNGDNKSTLAFQNFDAYAKNETEEYGLLHVGQHLTLGDLELENLNNGLNYTDYNEGSIVLLSDSPGHTSFLLASDCDGQCETDLVENYEHYLDVDILRVAHHGSAAATGWSLVDAVSPKIAVISVGENSYGHPDEDVIERLEDAGAEVFITKTGGDFDFEV